MGSKKTFNLFKTFKQKLSFLLSLCLILTSFSTPFQTVSVYAAEDVGENAFYVDEYTPTATNWDMYDEDYLDLFMSWNRDRGPISYNIYYDYQGGVLDAGVTNPDTYSEEMENDIILNNPHKPGYTFDGWIGTDDANADITRPMITTTISVDSVGDRYYRAMFTPITYHISYDYDGGFVLENNPSRYTVEDSSFNLNNAYKEGYIFKGYVIKKGDGEFSENPIKYTGSTQLTPGSGENDILSNLTIKAVYEERTTPFIKELPQSTPILLGSVLGLSELTGGKVVVSEEDNTELAGTWRWVNELTLPTLDDSETTLYNVMFLPNDIDNYAPVTGKITVKVNPLPDERIRPYIAQKPTGSDAYEKDPLGSSILTGGVATVSETDDTAVDGKWVWSDSSIILSLDDSETTEFTTFFIPDDTFHYAPVSTTIKIKVGPRPDERITPFIKETPKGSDAFKEDPLGSSILSGGKVTISETDETVLSGKWMWDDPSTILMLEDSEDTAFKVWFIPEDTFHYQPVSTDITIKVNEIPDNRISPYIKEDPEGSDAYEKDPLGSSILSGGKVTISRNDATEVPGKWMWNDAAIVLSLNDSETTEFDVWFVPEDTFHYKPVATAIKIKVSERPDERITPFIKENPNGSDAYKDEFLGSSILTGGEVTVSETDDTKLTGQWIWTNPSKILSLDDSEFTEFDVKFIPDDSFHYRTVATKIKIKVTERPDVRISPFIKEKPEGSGVYENDPLGKSILTGGKVTVSSNDATEISGTWFWEDASYITALTDSDTTEFITWFMPNDTYHYKPVSTKIKINVTEAPDVRIDPFIKENPTGSDAYTEDVLGSSILTGGKVTVSETDETEIDGQWIWINPSTVLNLNDSETTEFDVRFIPDDSFHYHAVNSAIKIKVKAIPDNRITPFIKENPNGSDAYEKDYLCSSLLTGGKVTVSSNDATEVTGRWIWDDASHVLTTNDSETTDFTVWFVPNDSFHYKSVATDIRIKVLERPDERITPLIKENPNGSDAYEKEFLGSSILTGGSVVISDEDNTAVEGKWIWDNSAIVLKLSDSDTTDFKVWFIPVDSFHYKAVSTDINIKVLEKPDDRITPFIKEKPDGSDAYEKDPLGSSVLTGGIVTLSQNSTKVVPGKWVWDDASYILTLTDSETTDFTTWFMPDDTAVYKPVSTTIKIKVSEDPDERIAPVIKENPKGSDTYEKDYLGSSILTGGKVTVSDEDNTTVPGKWVWDNAAYLLALSDSEATEFMVWFVPSDTFHYKPVSTKIKIKVSERPDERITPFIKEIPEGSDAFVDNYLGNSIITGGKVTVSSNDATEVSGRWIWENVSYQLSLTDSETTQFKVIYIPDDTFHYKNVSTDITIKVKETPDERVTPFVKEAPNGSDAYENDPLGSSILSGGEVTVSETDNTKIDGYWVWGNASKILSLDDSETTEFTTWFVPSDTFHYKPVSTDITIKVTERPDNRITPFIKEKPEGSDAYAEDALGSSVITGGEVTVSENNTTVVPGKWMWDNASTILSVDDSEATEFTTWFVPKDTFHYKSVDTGITIKITERPDPTAKEPYVKVKPYVRTKYIDGENIGSKEVVGGEVTVSIADNTVVSGNWVWGEAHTIVHEDDNETTEYEVIFVPTDNTTYKTVTTTITVPVDPAPVKIVPFIKNLPDASAAYAEDCLGSSILTGGEITVSETDDTVITGLWVWVNPARVLTIEDSENTDFTLWFIPNDTEKYQIISAGKKIKIKNRPNNDRIVPFIEEKPYVSGEYTVSDNIGKKIIEGGKVTISENNHKTVSGNWIWEKPYETVSISDNDVTEYKVIYVPYDLEKYDTTTTTITVRVKDGFKKTVPVLSDGLPVGSAIYEEELLERSYLTGGRMQVSEYDNTEVEGYWYWRYPKTQVFLEDSNNRLFDIMFIPFDTDNYEMVTAAITIPVLPKVVQKMPYADGEIEGSAIYEYTALGGSKITGVTVYTDETKTEEVFGKWLWVNPSVLVKPEDSKYLIDPKTTEKSDNPEKTRFEAVFVPDDTQEWANLYKTAAIEVLPIQRFEQQEALLVELPVASPITEGEYLAASILTGGKVIDKDDIETEIPGIFVWKHPDLMPALSDSLTTLYDVVFIPDSYEYTKVDGEITVEVLPLVPDVVEIDNSVTVRRPDASAIFYGQILKDSILTGGEVSDKDGSFIEGTWSWNNDSIMPEPSDSNKTLYDVTFTTTETPARIFTAKTFLEVKEREKYKIGDVYVNKYKANNIYTGFPICPKVSCTHSQQEYNAFGYRDGKMKTVKLKENVDYIVEYENNVNAGTGFIIIKGIGDYEGMVKKPFTITQKSMKSFKIDEMPNFVYTGENLAAQISANVVVRDKDQIVDPKDYIVQITGDTIGKPDQATYLSVAVKANTFGNYTDGISKNYKFAILGKDSSSVAKCKVSFKKASKKPYIFKNKGHKPAVIVTDEMGNKLSKKNYSVNYYNNVNAGKAYVIVRGKGSYYGAANALTFDIQPADMNACKVSSIKTIFFKGALTDLIPKVTFKKLNLIKDKDFQFKASDIEETGFGLIKLMKVTGTVSSCSTNFTGTKPVKLVVNKRNIGDKLKTRIIPNMTISKDTVSMNSVSGNTISNNTIGYDIGSKDTGILKKMIPSDGHAVVYYNGELLREGVDYTIIHKKDSKGNSTFTVKGIGCFKGKRTIKAKLNIENYL